VPLQIIVGAPTDNVVYQRIAALVRDQLAAAGVSTLVVAAPPTELFTQQLVQPAPATTVTGPPSAAPTTTPAPTTSPRTPEITGPVRVDVMVLPRTVGGDPATELASDYGCPAPTPALPDPPPGPTGYCFPALQPLLDAALIGTVPAAEAIQAAERSLWAQLPAIPLFQVVNVLAVTSRAAVATGAGPGPLLTGPLTGAQSWRPIG
jgi:ABC-type transport system substrate-binding protein